MASNLAPMLLKPSVMPSVSFCRASKILSSLSILASFQRAGSLGRCCGPVAPAFQALIEPLLGQWGAVPLPHVLVELAGVAAFQFVVDGGHVNAELVGYVLRAVPAEV